MLVAGSTPITVPTPCLAMGAKSTPSLLPNSSVVALFGSGKNRATTSSAIKTLRDHFAEYAAEVVARFLPDPKSATTLEFGSMMEYFWRPLQDRV